MADATDQRSSSSSFRTTMGWALLTAFVLLAIPVGDLLAPPRDFLGIRAYPIIVWQALYVVGFGGFVILLAAFSRRPPRTVTILVAAVVLRIPLLFCPPNSDCNRYIWEGRIQNEGFSPYLLSPDGAPPALRDEIHAGINHPHYPTIYPPLSQLEFRAMAAVCYSVKTPQAVHAALDVMVMLLIASLLVRLDRPRWHLAVYALCPMVLASFAHAGHNDTLMLIGVLAFVRLALDKSWIAAGTALGCAVLAKTTPAILLALLVRRSWKGLIAALVTITLGYLLYIDAGWRLFDVLHKFPGDGPFNNPFDCVRVLVRDLGGPVTFLSQRNMVAAILLVAAGGVLALRPRDLVNDARWLLVVTVLLLPIIHFWYLTWPLALVTLQFRGRWAWVVLTGTIVLYWYADFAGLAGLKWDLPKWAVAAIWLPFFATWFWEWRRCVRSCPAR